ncbi:hypothetical protein JHD49_10255 [Sulfurimonas sp. SAG-AH-194-C21]|nr:RAMP superfamily CRISPR-associated protein [Sulfurimonas sp. SAG-AH-194-C21]MDF1884324.1 hypothetical protein [Sulfurimonas sp. SAG-AH-194-C21]
MKTRQVAHIIIEADTPLKVGSNASDFLQDNPIQKDWNGLPMILGTSIAGVLRKDFNENLVDDIFGKDNGSKVIFSNALLLDENMQVNEGLLQKKTPFLQLFDILPIREHTSMTDKGVVKEHAKFDEEVLYKGTRFKFSIEMIDNEQSFEQILDLLSIASFRLGGGSSKGFGKLKILSIKTGIFNLASYENYTSTLNHQLSIEYKVQSKASQTHTKYTLSLTPDDFFIFGSSFGDDEADSTPIYEKVVDYDSKKLSDKQLLLPASSIKGAIAHRTTFHYNSLVGNTIEDKNGFYTIEAIFGSAKDSENKTGKKGKVIFCDCFKKDKKETKTFDHVSIDRFTGGALDGALFQEKTIAQKDMWEIEILLSKDIEGNELQAFENTLTDITTGMLPFGGMTTKGHGFFTGELLRDGEKI